MQANTCSPNAIFLESQQQVDIVFTVDGTYILADVFITNLIMQILFHKLVLPEEWLWQL